MTKTLENKEELPANSQSKEALAVNTQTKEELPT